MFDISSLAAIFSDEQRGPFLHPFFFHASFNSLNLLVAEHVSSESPRSPWRKTVLNKPCFKWIRQVVYRAAQEIDF